MANLPENSDFEAGVYQIELTDEVVGGADGISNRQGRQLANRTRWLKDQVDILNNLKGKTIPAFSIANSYLAGEIVSHLKNIWRANTNVSPGAFNPSQWTKLLGTAAEADRMTAPWDTTAGALMVLGALGWGGNSLNNTESADNYTIGSFMGIDASESASVALNLPALGGVGTSSRSWRVLTFGEPSRTVQIAVEVFGVSTVRGRSFKRVKHDSTWHPWVEDATLASPAFTGNPTAPTAPQFDNDTSLANTEWVTRRGVEFADYVQITDTNATLGAAHIGKFIQVSSLTGTLTITLPLTTSVPLRSVITLVSTANNPVTLACQGSDKISSNGAAISDNRLRTGETVTLVAGPANTWMIAGGTMGLKDSALFGSSLASTGYQRLPSGLIIQWGITSSGNNINVSPPIAFPNAIFSVTANSISTSGFAIVMIKNMSATGFTLSAEASTASGPFTWIAIGH